MKYLLDTNVFREIGKARPRMNVAAWLNRIDDVDLAISALTVREVTKGIEKLRRSKPDVADQIATRVVAIFEALDGRILPVDRAVAAAWGEFLAASEKHADDAGLAATAHVHKLTVVTRNIRDFATRGVPTLDPFKPI